MNNEQFRNLFTAKAPDGTGKPSTASRSGVSGTLGARQRASIPMTPRSSGLNINNEFARQIAERNRAANPQKRLRMSAPKGVKLADGYIDRAKTRQEEEDDNEKTSMIKALEELLEKGEIDKPTFEKLHGEIAGGDLSTTHMVKGLDFKLLERIRRGENVYGKPETQPDDGKDTKEDAAVDDELDKVLSQEFAAVGKEKREKKGLLSTVATAPGKKRTRDQILADLKAARLAAAKQKEEELGGKFKKIGATQKPGTRIERDSKGREVLIIVDEDGHVKRKIRKTRPGEVDENPKDELPMPDRNAKPLGMEVPEAYRKKEEPEEDDDVDIFDGVGDDYDPLAGLGSDGDSDSDSEVEAEGGGERAGVKETTKKDESTTDVQKPSAPRNYFQGSKTGLMSQEEVKAPSLSDPSIQAALKKAAALKPVAPGADEDEDGEQRAARERRKRLLETVDRDADDIDMGFGMSRNEDEEDFDERKIKLSKWGEDDDEERGRSKGGQKRKRGPKKRKGDGNNADDVMRVLEQRKAAGS
ncbi:uncharacterized protein DNG_00601 [Cephalotrichum gorgonifer]|uniref:RED-like N-terminal domain-containing protein n=1 Tax=Cephalotrichum gorgonifer TaxID=2041049 RepID=A0AAE8MP53_9PEZI|nr:uncharacterized protein DNG_00601 [Cephalotrichum gorgonifer]